jgi:mannitol/fructose-specific phosphotransferase system IIA component (Ntr-type)
MLIGPPSASRDHVRILGRISRLLQPANVRKAVLAAKSPDEIISVLEDAEEEILGE